MTEHVRISVREGPVILLDAPATGVTGTYPLWNGASATEFFPLPGKEHFYDVTLEKPVTHAREVRPAEEELTNALLLIAAAWSFSGGSYMAIQRRQVISSSAFRSNADEVERQLLASEGFTKHSFHVSRSPSPTSSVSYSVPPLKNAIAIANTMRSDYATGQLVKYYHEAWVNRPRLDEASWFVNLYKVRDALKEIYRGEKQVQTALRISATQWKDVGALLNKNDYRHAEISGKPPRVSATQIDDVYTIARRWVADFLRTKNLTIF